MKCEICETHDVTRAIRKVVDGFEQDVFVCESCARVECSGYASTEPIDRFSPDGALSRVPNVKVFMDATIKIAGLNSGKRCPRCGFRLSGNASFRNLGCPACYKTFEQEIRERRLEGRYRGKRPQEPVDGIEIIALKSQIDDAVREQRFDDVFRLKLALEDVESRVKRLRSSEGES